MTSYTKGTNFTAKDSLVTGNPSKLVKGSEIDAELNAIAAAIATKVDTSTLTAYQSTVSSTYAPLASPALTGTPTAPTATSGTNNTQVATTAFVQQAAFNAVLPSQTGNAGKFVKTDGTNASWDYAGISTVGATVTDNYTIVSTTPTIWPCATTALGKSITAPVVTTSTPKGLFAVIDNKAGGYPVGWRDSTGSLIMAVAAGGVAQVYLEDNSTAAGTWRVSGTNLEPGLITIDSTFSSTYSSTVLKPFVALDSNTSIHFAQLASGFSAFIVDNTGKVLTTPVTVTSSGSPVINGAFKVSATSAIVFFNDAGGYKAVVLTVSGSSPSLSLAVGTAATDASGDNPWQADDFSGAPKIAQLSSTLYVISYTSTTFTKVMAVSVSGSTVTLGTGVNIITANSVSNSTTTYALTATTALVLYNSGAAAPYNINAVVVSVSGTTCTVGTPQAAASTTNPNTGVVCMSCLLSSTKALVCVDNNTTTTVVHACTISGTTVSWGAALTVETGVTGFTTVSSYTASSATRYNPHLFPLSSSAAFLWYLDSSNISRAVVLSESGGTVTAGTIAYRTISAASSNNGGEGYQLGCGTTESLAVIAGANSTATVAQQINLLPSRISGTTVTAGAMRSLRNMYPRASAIAALRLTSGDYVLTAAASGVQPSPVVTIVRSNGDAINYRGEVSVPGISIGTGTLTAAVSSNRVILLGALSLGSQGSTTQQLRLLNLEIAQ